MSILLPYSGKEPTSSRDVTALSVFPSPHLQVSGEAVSQSPFAVAPSLDKVIANQELMPLKMNLAKKAKITERQRALAQRLKSAGML